VNLLFIHQNFPGQYRHLAPALQAVGHRCKAIATAEAIGLPGIPLHRYRPRADPAPAGLHPWAHDLHVKCVRAEAVAHQADQLRNSGFLPDLIIGHPGWGELLAIKDVFPDVPVLHQLEFVYQLQGADCRFDPEFSNPGWRDASRLRLRRAPQLLAFHDLDHALAPTRWQASTAPPAFAGRVSVVHEGIDTTAIRPDPQARIQLQKAGLSFQPGDPVVTFAARQLEPYRGFHIFMRMLPRLQALRPDCHVLIVGGDAAGYGPMPADGRSWRQTLLAELGSRLDLARIHFVGRIPHPVLHNLFQVSACHVYLTYPFVLSWSLLEAMSCGTVVVGSATAPVQEVIRHGENGLLVDFFNPEALAASVAAVLDDRAGHARLGAAARATVQRHYDLHQVCLPAQLRLVQALAAGRAPT